MEYLINKFNEIRTNFENELRAKQEIVSNTNLNYCILGSPLFKSDYLILSTNWGGPIEKESGQNMPTVNELLAFPTLKNNCILIKFFTKLIDDNCKLIDFLNNSIYTNACFIRTPNTKDDQNKRILNLGFDISLSYLRQLINVIEPKVIICFGNGESGHSPTRSIVKIMNMNTKWWLDLNEEQNIKISAQSYCYQFENSIDDKLIKVFSFPHSNNIARWTEQIGKDFHKNNFIFNNLKYIINNG